MAKFGVEDFLEAQGILKEIKKEYDITKFSDQVSKVNSELDILEDMMNKDYKILKKIRNDLDELDKRFSLSAEELNELDKLKVLESIIYNLPKGVQGELIKDNNLILKLFNDDKEVGNINISTNMRNKYLNIRMYNKNNGEIKRFLLESEHRIYKVILYIYLGIYGN